MNCGDLVHSPGLLGSGPRGVIVNADDFGLHEAANRGIVGAFERGLISSTTLMANQPGFEEAVELAHHHGLEECVGIHLVLTRGTPLSDVIRRLPRFCDRDGLFRNWRSDGRVWRIPGLERQAVMDELTAQVQRVRDAGLQITHVDSHHHVHNEWGIGACVIAVSRSMAIPFVRLARNCGPSIGIASSPYKRAFNRRLRLFGLARTRWFGDVTDWLHLQATGADGASLDDFELMTHPQLDAEGEVVDADMGIGLSTLLSPIPGVRSATSYAGARRPVGRDAADFRE